MTFKWRTGWNKFNFYVKKYDFDVYEKIKTLLKEAKEEIYNKLSLNSIYEIVTDNTPSEYIKVLE